MNKYRLALIQMRVGGGDKTANIERAVKQIAQASDEGADCALLPEAMDLGWTHPSSLTEAELIPGGAPCNALAKAALDHGIYVCAGLTEKDGDDIYNSAVMISPIGELLIKHRKLNELGIGHEYYGQGDRLNVARTELGTLGLMICADAFAKDLVLARSLCYMGADVILSPCAWAVQADHDNATEPYGKLWIDSYSPVAKEFAVWIIGVSNVGWMTGGPWEGRKCIGCSMAVNPEGEVVLQSPYGPEAEAIEYINISPQPRPARGCGWVDYWDASDYK